MCSMAAVNPVKNRSTTFNAVSGVAECCTWRDELTLSRCRALWATCVRRFWAGDGAAAAFWVPSDAVRTSAEDAITAGCAGAFETELSTWLSSNEAFLASLWFGVSAVSRVV